MSKKLSSLALALCCLLPASASADWQRVGGFGVAGSGPGQFNGVEGIDVTFIPGQPGEFLWVTDQGNNRVQQLDTAGTFIREIGTGPAPNSQLLGPSDAVYAGILYVTDDGHQQVRAYDEDGTFLGVGGSEGSGEGQYLFNDAEIDVAPVIPGGGPRDGDVYVTDQGGNSRVQVFTPNGAFLDSFGGFSSSIQDGRHQSIAGIAIAPDGTVYTTDRALNRVQHFEADGTFIEKWGRNGGDGSAGSGPGSFDDPRSVAVDNAGFVYVADAGNSRIQKFTSRGGFLSEFGNGRGGLPANIFFSMSAVAASQQVPPVIYVTDPIVGTGFPGAQPGPSAIQSFREFTPLPEPEKTAAGSLEKGTVTVREPGTNRFVELKADEAIPVGSTIDTREGTVQLLTANSRGQTQAARFHDGIFKFTQDRSGLVTLTLTEPLTGCAKPGKATAAARGPKVRQLWGSGRGRYRTEGRHSVGSVRGTVWLTRDTCDGTLTKVREGVVAVRDLAKKRTVLVKKGGRYFARAKKR